MKFESVDKTQSIELQIKISGYADDDYWVKDANLSVTLHGIYTSGSLKILAYLREDSNDEIAVFISQLREAFSSLNSKAELVIEGSDPDCYDKRALKLVFFPISSTGQMAFQAELSGSNRFSNLVELPFHATTAFQIDPSLIEETANNFEALYDAVHKTA